jgi:hypothetical protein
VTTYFRDEEIDVKVELSLLPRPFITGMMTTAMPAAMRPYSIAVAAVSFRRKALSFPNIRGV